MAFISKSWMLLLTLLQIIKTTGPLAARDTQTPPDLIDTFFNKSWSERSVKEATYRNSRKTSYLKMKPA